MNWYKSIVPKEMILCVKICRHLPLIDWDEQWFAEELYANCARQGCELYLAGDNIPVLPSMFEGFLSVKKFIGLEQMNTAGCVDFSRVFASCTSLKEIDLNAWNSSAVTSMAGLFDGCIHLEHAELASLDLSKCCSTKAMFRECNRLQTVDVGDWNVSKVRDFSSMFSCCYNLKELDVSRWNTISAQSIKAMFNRCCSLTKLELSAWNTEQVKDFSLLFHRCEKLKKLDLKTWYFSNDAQFHNMFLRMFGKITLPRQMRFNRLKAGNSWACEKLRPDKLRQITMVEFRKMIEEPSWIDSCWAVDEADSGFLCCMKQGDRLLISSRGGGIYANKNSRMLFCFPDPNGDSWLRQIEGLELLNTRYTEDFSFMFSGNSGLLRLSTGHFNMKKAKDLTGMFLNCRNLRSIENENWQIPSDAQQQGMTQGCDNLGRGLRIL